MTFYLLAFAGGVLTILSPCILPVLPFVFARADQPFRRAGLPMLLGMAVTFAGVATLAAVGGGWAVHANQYGRIAALVLMALFGITLLSGRLAEHLTRPFVALGNRLTADAGAGASVWSSALLGVATGFLWAPCAGPILGLILTGAAIRGAGVGTGLLLLAYALGAAASLAAALLAGGRIFAAMKKSLGAGEWIRRALGAAVLVGVAAIALGLDTGLLTRISLGSTTRFETMLVQQAGHGRASAPAPAGNGVLPVEGMMPPLTGATGWINSPPLTQASLRGKVVVVDFWTYSCINCLRALPYIEGWAKKYGGHGLVVIGVHSPEFAFEKDAANVRRAVRNLGITYPVATDNNFTIWELFKNDYWPAHFFIDAKGRIRAHQFGEGDYGEGERIIQTLLAEAGMKDVPGGIAAPKASGAMAAADRDDLQSPETYLGYDQAQNFISLFAKDQAHDYALFRALKPNEWGLAGRWSVDREKALLNAAPGRIAFRFHARDLHMVLGTADGRPVRFRVRLDGALPGAAHGGDTDAAGNGTVTGQRLYQLIRQKGPVADHTFEIEFLDGGAEAYTFTFG